MEEGTYGLIDFDLFLYEVGFGAEVDGEPLPFELVKGRIDEKVATFYEVLNLTDHEGYITGKGNFRYDIAKTQPYKGNRKDSQKPFHFENIKQYLIFKHKAVLLEGIEADDMLAVRQKQLGKKSIIISRDKDLRMIEGWQWGWECGKQGEFGPFYVSGLGEIDDKGRGYGIKFFWAQMLMGDPTDNIIGCRRRGKLFAYKLLKDIDTLEEIQIAVAKAYMDVYGEEWNTIMLEQGRLLWMHDTLNADGTPVLWELPKVVEELTYEES